MVGRKTQALSLEEDCDFSQTLWGKILIKSCEIELNNASRMIINALDIIRKSEGLEKYLAVFEEDLSNIDDLLATVVSNVDVHHNNQNKWDGIYEKAISIQFSRLPRVGKNADKEKQEIVKKYVIG